MGVTQTFEYIDIGDVLGDNCYQDETLLPKLVPVGGGLSSEDSEESEMNLQRIKTLPTA
jgi:hypothetical protein